MRVGQSAQGNPPIGTTPLFPSKKLLIKRLDVRTETRHDPHARHYNSFFYHAISYSLLKVEGSIAKKPTPDNSEFL